MCVRVQFSHPCVLQAAPVVGSMHAQSTSQQPATRIATPAQVVMTTSPAVVRQRQSVAGRTAVQTSQTAQAPVARFAASAGGGSQPKPETVAAARPFQFVSRATTAGASQRTRDAPSVARATRATDVHPVGAVSILRPLTSPTAAPPAVVTQSPATASSRGGDAETAEAPDKKDPLRKRR